MEDNENVVNSAVTTVEPQEVVEPVQTPNTQPTVENTDETNQRDFEKDSAFAKIRRKAEEAEKELEKTRTEKQKLEERMKRFGFNGNVTEEILDQADAHFYGKSVEEIRKERIAQEEKIKSEEQIKQELEYYHNKEIENQMKADLTEIQKMNPNIKSLDDLGEPFFDFVRRGIDGVKAYKLLELDGLVESKNIEIEQQAIRKLQANANSSVGALDSKEAKVKTIAEMSDAEFEVYIQRAKRGELKRE